MVIFIGLTGGIACGKSVVARYLVEQGYVLEVIDADKIVHDLQGPGARCTRKIGKLWPHVVDSETGELNRAALAKIIFENPSARKKLAGIMNLPIFMAIMKALFNAWWNDLALRFFPAFVVGRRQRRRSRIDIRSFTPYIVVLDAPTLFETRMFVPLVSDVLVVSSPVELQKKRILDRCNNGAIQMKPMTEEEAISRINAQMPLEQKKALAGYVIENNYTDNLAALLKDVERSVVWMNQQSEWKLHLLFGAGLFLCGFLGIGVTALVFRNLSCLEYY